MLNFKKKLIIIIIFLVQNSAYSYQPNEGNVSGGLGFFISQNNSQNSNYEQTNPVFGGFYLIFEGDLNSVGSLEIDLSYFQKLFTREFSNQFVAEKTEILNVNLGYRRWISNKISIGLGFSSMYTIGEKSIIFSEFTPSNSPDTSASAIVKYGAEFSAQFELWSNQYYSIFFDNRYNYSFSNKEKESADHFLHMIGFKQIFQSK